MMVKARSFSFIGFRIPMRGYEDPITGMLLRSILVPNPHEGL